MEAPESSPEPILAQVIPEKKEYPFLQLSGEIRNQIHLEIIGPELPRRMKLDKSPHYHLHLGESKFLANA